MCLEDGVWRRSGFGPFDHEEIALQYLDSIPRSRDATRRDYRAVRYVPAADVDALRRQVAAVVEVLGSSDLAENKVRRLHELFEGYDYPQEVANNG